MRQLIFIFLLVNSFELMAQDKLHPTGNIFDVEQYSNLLYDNIAKRSLKKEVKNYPIKYSLEKYCPTPGDQGQYGTCSAWALAAARTILLAKNKNITDQKTIDSLWFSPGFIYHHIKQSIDNECSKGSYIEYGLDILAKYGVCFDRTLPQDCNVEITTQALKEAQQYAIQGSLRITNNRNDGLTVKEIKDHLYNDGPLITSFKVPNSFHKNRTGYWQPESGENPKNDENGDHAMVIIAFDDKKQGGALLLMNSWGTTWGGKGFVWVSYKNFMKWYTGVHYIIPQEKELMPEMKDKLHLFLVADTEADDTPVKENAVRNSVAFLKAFHAIGISALLHPIDYALTGNKCNKKQLLQTIRQSEIAPNDAVVLYYIGKGVNTPNNDYPNLQFDGYGSMLLTDLEQVVQEKGARLSIVMADCNNQDKANYTKPGKKLISFLLPKVDDQNLKWNISQQGYFSKLFNKFKGQILIAACKKEQRAIYDKNGSFFLRAMLQSMLYSASSAPDWLALLNLTKAKTQLLAQADGYEQEPIFRVQVASPNGDNTQICDISTLTQEYLENFKRTWPFERKKKLAYGIEALCTPDAEVVVLLDGIMIEKLPAMDYFRELVVNPTIDSIQIEKMIFDGCRLKELYVTEFYPYRSNQVPLTKDNALLKRLEQKTVFLWYGISRVISDTSTTEEEKNWIEKVMLNLFETPNDSVEYSILRTKDNKEEIKSIPAKGYILERISKYYKGRYDKLKIAISIPKALGIENGVGWIEVKQQFIGYGKELSMDYEDETTKEVRFKLTGDFDQGFRIKMNKIKVLKTLPLYSRP